MCLIKLQKLKEIKRNSLIFFNLTAPDSPANCSVKNNSIVNDVDNTSFHVEFFSPKVSKGFIAHFSINAWCIALDSMGPRPFYQVTPGLYELDIPSEHEGGPYEYLLNGLQSYSHCTVFIAASTRVGYGPAASCSELTPFVGSHISNIIF